MNQTNTLKNILKRKKNSLNILKALILSEEEEPGSSVIHLMTHPTHITVRKLKKITPKEEDITELLKNIELIQKQNKLPIADCGCLLLALIKTPCHAGEILKNWEFAYKEIWEHLQIYWIQEECNDEYTNENEFESEGETQNKSNWKDYGINLNEQSKENNFSLIGRIKEIKRISQILGLKTKNNPILVGKNGTGKTAIIQGIAKAIEDKENWIPPYLQGKTIFSLDLSSIVAGTTLRGQFEERIQNIINEITKDKNIILFLDQTHELNGAGAGNGNIDAGTLLQKPLSQNKFQIIGATTQEELMKMEKTGNIIRSFQKVEIEQPSKKETLNILKGVKSEYKKHYNISYSNEIIESIIECADKELPQRSFPEKALTLMDETGSYAKIKNETIVNENHLYNALTQMTGIPDYRYKESASVALTRIEKEINSKVIGQNYAKKKLMQCLARAYTGIKDPNRPIASLLFLGPAGTGKTLLAQTLASTAFANKESITIFDMGEYKNVSDVYKLIGTSFESGKLTQSIQNNPYQVILFDEVEKAHPDIYDSFLQIMEGGRLTDSSGIEVNMKHCIIIMTSNIGAHLYDKGQVGFGNTSESLEDSIISELKNVFRPELLDRIDETVVFKSPKEKELMEICEIEINKICKRLNKQNFNITAHPKLMESIAKHAKNKNLRGRSLRNTIEKSIGNFVSNHIINTKIIKNNKYIINGEGLKSLELEKV